MKHVLSPLRKYGRLPAKTDQVEETIRTASRIAGPVALVIGYIGAYLLFRYLF